MAPVAGGLSIEQTRTTAERWSEARQSILDNVKAEVEGLVEEALAEIALDNLRKRMLAEIPAVVEEATDPLKTKRSRMHLSSSPDPKGMSVAEIEAANSH